MTLRLTSGVVALSLWFHLQNGCAGPAYGPYDADQTLWLPPEATNMVALRPLELTPGSTCRLELAYTWVGPRTSSPHEFGADIYFCDTAGQTSSTPVPVEVIGLPGFNSCSTMFAVPRDCIRTVLRLSKSWPASVSVNHVRVEPCVPQAGASGDMLEDGSPWTGFGFAHTRGSLRLLSQESGSLTIVAQRPVTLSPLTPYYIEIEYRWDGPGNRGCDLYADLYSRDPAWDDSSCNFVCSADAPSLNGRSRYCATVAVATIPSDLSLRLIKSGPATVTVETLVIRPQRWYDDVHKQLPSLALMAMAAAIASLVVITIPVLGRWWRSSFRRRITLALIHASSWALPAAACAVPVLSGLLYVYCFGINTPWLDHWDYLHIPASFRNGSLTFTDLWANRDHRIIVPHLIWICLSQLTRHNCITVLYSVQCVLVGVFLLYLAVFRKHVRHLSLPRALWLCVPIAYLAFHLRQNESMLYSMASMNVYCLGFSVFALFLLHRSCGTVTTGWWAFCGAAVAAVLASCSAAQGLLVWLCGLLLFFLAPRPSRSLRLLPAMIWLASGSAAWFLVLYHLPRQSAEVSDYGLLATYVLSVLGGSLCWTLDTTMAAGVLILLYAPACVFLLFKAGRLRHNAFWLALASYSALGCLAISFGRLVHGLELSTASRYATTSLPLVVSLYAMTVDAAINGDCIGRRVRPALATFVALLALTVLPAIGNALDSGATFLHAREMGAYCILNHENAPRELLDCLHPHVTPVEAGIPFLERYGLGPFSYAARGIVYPPSMRYPEPADLIPLNMPPQLEYTVNGQMVTAPVDHVVSSSPFLVVKGHALDALACSSAGGVFVRIDGQMYPAFYGVHTPDIARYYHNKRYLYCGFLFSLPTAALGPGSHSLSVCVISADRRCLFFPAQTTVFKL